jgi:DNA-binding transcriptional ArsR family regulator
VSDHPHPVDPERVAAARANGVPAGEAEAMAALLTLLADPLRSRILSALLVTDEMCVGDLALSLGATEDAVSYALRLLRTAGLVRRRREGRMGYYRLRDGNARDALQASLDQLRRLVALHPEESADDAGTPEPERGSSTA